jgi:hypothetical protein
MICNVMQLNAFILLRLRQTLIYHWIVFGTDRADWEIIMKKCPIGRAEAINNYRFKNKS